MGLDVGYFQQWISEKVAALNLAPRLGEAHWAVAVTLDVGWQEAAIEAIRRALTAGEHFGVGQAALIAMSADGQVRALVGGADFAKSQFDRATQALRQPGSTFKPFVYLAALEEGMQPTSKIDDRPIVLDGWNPRNDDGKYLGSMTLADALAESRNAATVRLAKEVGFDRIAAMAARFGLPTGDSPSFVLGTEEVSLIELVRAYAMVAAGGRAVDPRGIVAILDEDGHLIFQPAPSTPHQVVPQVLTEKLAGMLRLAVSGGTGKSANLDAGAAGKTGTSQNNRDAWFVGFDGQLVAGVWMGNDNGAPMRSVSGGSLPARTWRDFMEVAVASSALDFPVSPDVKANKK